MAPAACEGVSLYLLGVRQHGLKLSYYLYKYIARYSENTWNQLMFYYMQELSNKRWGRMRLTGHNLPNPGRGSSVYRNTVALQGWHENLLVKGGEYKTE